MSFNWDDFFIAVAGFMLISWVYQLMKQSEYQLACQRQIISKMGEIEKGIKEMVAVQKQADQNGYGRFTEIQGSVGAIRYYIEELYNMKVEGSYGNKTNNT